MDYTSEQRAAIETHDRNVIVIAGAGSGKTRVLVDRFVSLLAAYPDWPVASLAAITFTEKAARELRDRIRHAINRRIEDAETPEIRVFWQQRGSSLDGARIGTIHSLCALIVRANAAVLNIDPGFKVLDENDAMLARDEALTEALTELTLSPAAQLFLHYKIEEIRDALEKSFDWALNTSAPKADPSALYAQMSAPCLDEMRNDPEFIEALAWRPDLPPDPSDKLLPIWNQIDAVRPDLSSTDNTRVMAGLQICAKTNRINVGTDKNWHGQVKIAQRHLGVLRKWAQSVQKQLGVWDNTVEALTAELIPHWLTAIALTQQAYRHQKSALHALDFDDLETDARKLLNDESIRARYRGGEFNHVLVDEFQDTNAAQREIVYALTGLDRPGSLFIVGDPKQAIYGFRGADVRVFEQVRQEIMATGGVEISLNQSFRAHSGLIKSLNDLFCQLDMGVSYEPLISVRVMESHHTPAIEIYGLDKDNAIQPERGKVLTDDLRAWEAQVLAIRFENLVNSRHTIWDRTESTYRPLVYGDCAVLFPSRKGMPAVEYAFKAANIPFVTVSGIGYYDRPEVQDVLSLLQVLADPADELALAAVLRSPLYGISDDGLYGLRLWHSGKSLWNALMSDTTSEQPDAEAIKFAARSLHTLHGWGGRVTNAELISRALDATGFIGTLTGLDDGVRRVGNVEKLLDMARTTGRISLSAFLLLLKNRSNRELREGEAPIEAGGAVQLMTIHASKGLEFPVVALFEASNKGNKRPSLLYYDDQVGLGIKVPKNSDEDQSKDRWHKPTLYRAIQQQVTRREQSEKIRLLYVALTRAADKLIILGEHSKNGKEADESSEVAADAPVQWMEVLSNAFKLPGDPIEQVTHIDQSGGTIDYFVPHQEMSVAPQPLVLPNEQRVNLLSDISDSTPVYMPPLLIHTPVTYDAPTRTLTATMVAKLGEAHAIRSDVSQVASRDRFARFRRQILHNAIPDVPNILPTLDHVEATNSQRHEREFNRAIGKIVHRALQFGLASDNSDTPALLNLYALQAGLIDEMSVIQAVEEAMVLLAQCERSEGLQPIRATSKNYVYRELPFTLQLGERSINGQIDVLYMNRFGDWTVLDYKTDDIRRPSIAYHSRRYWGQVGVYALAVEAITGQLPNIQLFYVRPALTITVRESDWRGAIDRLDTDLQVALASSTDTY